MQSSRSAQLRRLAFVGLLGAAGLVTPAAQAADVVFGPHDVATVFFIAKSTDGNHADYGIRLDATCSPVNDDALIMYWRELDKTPVRTHGFSLLDRIPYGVSDQRVTQRSDSGGEYAVRLKQFTRPIAITTKKEPDGRCSATARSTINGGTAQLLSVFAKLSGPLSVDYIDVFGKDLATGASITERIKK